MFDFSFGEILVIAVVAVIFLGPDKLPQAFVKIAKIIRAVKKTIGDAKDALDREIHITEMKQDALEYKKKFADSAEKLKNEILSDVEGVKHEIEGAKSAAILNESLEKSSISFDEVESKGKSLQRRLQKNLKRKNAESSVESNADSGVESSADSAESAPKSPKKSKKVSADSSVESAESSADSSVKSAPKSPKSPKTTAPKRKKRTPTKENK